MFFFSSLICPSHVAWGLLNDLLWRDYIFYPPVVVEISPCGPPFPQSFHPPAPLRPSILWSPQQPKPKIPSRQLTLRLTLPVGTSLTFLAGSDPPSHSVFFFSPSCRTLNSRGFPVLFVKFNLRGSMSPRLRLSPPGCNQSAPQLLIAPLYSLARAYHKSPHSKSALSHFSSPQLSSFFCLTKPVH